MAVLINNQPGISLGYEFGVLQSDGEILEFESSREAQTMASAVNGEVLMREVYATEWMSSFL